MENPTPVSTEQFFLQKRNKLIDKNLVLNQNRSSKMSKGVIYLATGSTKYIDECRFSAMSLKKHCPDIPITLFTDNLNIETKGFDRIIILQDPIHFIRLKVKILLDSPYDYTLFIDSDTQIVQPIDEMFEWLDEYDLGLANAPHMDWKSRPYRLISYKQKDTYNAGIILYKKSKNIDIFFEKWLENTMAIDENKISIMNDNEQNTLNKLIEEDYHLECGVKIKVFDNKIYNARPHMLMQLRKDGEMDNIKIIHAHYLERVYSNDGHLLKEEGKINQAIEQYLKALQINPKYIPALNQLAAIYESRKEFNQANIYYKHIVELQPENSLAQIKLGSALLEKGNIKSAITAYQKALTFKQEQPALIYRELGNALNQNDQIEEAIAAYTEAIKLNLEDPVIYRMLAASQLKFGDYTGGIASYQKAIDLNSQQPFWVYKGLGDSLSKQERFNEAIAAYTEAIKLRPEDPAVYRMLAASQLKFGDYTGVIASSQKAIDLNPQQPFWVYKGLGDALSKQERFDQAKAAYQKAMELKPDLKVVLN